MIPMKLITLNTWQGEIFEPFMKFVKKHADDTDIFCFQEVLSTISDKITDDGYKLKSLRVNLLQELIKAMPEYNHYFSPFQDGLVYDKRVSYPVSQGLAAFVKKSILVTKEEQIFVYGEKNGM